MKAIATGTPKGIEQYGSVQKFVDCMENARRDLSPEDYKKFLHEVITMLKEEA